jgi:Zn-dependent alcohol dehydrogenase
MKFTAAVLNRVATPLTIDELEMAPLAPHDVLVRVMASGLCHTDLEVIQGSLAYLWSLSTLSPRKWSRLMGGWPSRLA